MMKLTVLIPCFNEKDTILTILDRVLKAPIGDLGLEIIVVDDGSTDGTREILTGLTYPELRVVFHEKNSGKGAALSTGLRYASGDVLVIQDADLEYDPQDYPALLEPVMAGKADVVYGSRFIGNLPHRTLYFWHSVGNRFLTFLSNMCTNLNLTDMETCYKMMTRDVYSRLTLVERRFGVEPEMTAKLSKLKVRIYEVGIRYDGRTYEDGKKIGWKDGFWAIWCIFRYNVF